MLDRRQLVLFSTFYFLTVRFSFAASQKTDLAIRVIQIIDAMDVEHHWPAGIHINWETGDPEHGQVLLANAQYEWLLDAGVQQGWTQLPDMMAAQNAANAGQFVIAAYHNHNDDKPGHIAIVRPGSKSAAQLAAEGPDISQAGLDNFTSTTVKKGFADHKSAFAGNEILYFAHAVDSSALPK